MAKRRKKQRRLRKKLRKKLKKEEEDNNLVFFIKNASHNAFCVRGVFFYSSKGSSVSVSDKGSSTGRSELVFFFNRCWIFILAF